MSDSKDISPEDRDLFRASVGQVKPVRQQRQALGTRRPEPVPRQTERDQQAVLQEMTEIIPDSDDIEIGDELHYRRPGVQLHVLKQLRRGKFVIQGELDLHGMNSTDAKKALTAFLSECNIRRRRCVRIIHGKGRGSPDGRPVLKNKVNHWLQLHNDVLAYSSAPPMDGGTGAVYVLLRQRAR
jgi:DNA-nicking Smr family endonuclease